MEVQDAAYLEGSMGFRSFLSSFCVWVTCLVVAVIVVGCDAPQSDVSKLEDRPIEPLRPLKVAQNFDEINACFRALTSHPEHQVLGSKILLVYQSYTPVEMLADSSKPNRAEQKALRIWFSNWSECRAMYEDFQVRAGAPTNLLLVQKTFNLEFQQLIARLYSSQITFGEFNQARQRHNLQSVEAEETALRELEKEEMVRSSQAFQRFTEILRVTRPSPSVHCTSIGSGSTVNTTCN